MMTIGKAAAEIDLIDERLVVLLKQRFALSRLVGELKRRAGSPLSDPLRISTQTKRFVELCVGAGLSGTMAQAIIGNVIGQVLEERAQLATTSPT